MSVKKLKKYIHGIRIINNWYKFHLFLNDEITNFDTVLAKVTRNGTSSIMNFC